MNESIIAVRYTKALFSLSKENKIIEEVKADMEAIFSLMGQSKELQHFFQNPVLKPSKKIEITDLLFPSFHRVSKGFIDLLIKNRREEFLQDIARNFLEKVRVYNGIETAVFTTSVKVDASTLEKVKKIITELVKLKVELSNNIDERIIGGFVLKVGDKQYDASIRTGLNKIKRKLKETVI